ncbi:GNAT family N-acetyltransferase [Nocardia wallacei]|uniref:GNAT family N-acetyltransferase n=1 Tax=Nocardia wallacei TaxID=480035 RepID=UPI0024575A04|nr:GNAT family N-acetyltransferase [Nocardia wallacei]
MAPIPAPNAPITFRELDRDDVDAVVELHAALDERDSYYRFFGHQPRNLARIADGLSTNDPTHCAVGAFHAGRLVGMANLVVLPSSRTAETALVVAHEDQAHGIGTRLLHELARPARARGIQRLVADVLPSNARMMRLLTDSGLPFETARQDGVVHIAIRL